MANPTAQKPGNTTSNTNSTPSPAPTPAPVDSPVEDTSPENEAPVGRVVDSIPPTDRNGHWVQESRWFMDNPHKIKVYENVSQTSASYLRGKFGLDAQARNTRKVPATNQDGSPKMKDGKRVMSSRVDLYVRYIPERAEEIKAAAKSKAGGKKD